MIEIQERPDGLPAIRRGMGLRGWLSILIRARKGS